MDRSRKAPRPDRTCRLPRRLLVLALAGLSTLALAGCHDKTKPDEGAAMIVARRTLQDLLGDSNLRFEEEAAAQQGEEFIVSGTVHGKGSGGDDTNAQYLARLRFVCDDALDKKCQNIRYLQLRDRVLIPAQRFPHRRNS